MTDKKEQQTNNLDIAIMSTYFVIPFLGLRIAMENYLMEDKLNMGYVMLLGLVSGIIVTIYLTILKPKSTKVKLIGLFLLLTFVTIINLLVY